LLKVKLKLSPGLRSPEFHTPVLLVAEWCEASSFDHLTVSPALIVRFAGMNSNWNMLTGIVTALSFRGRTTDSAARKNGNGRPQKTSV
jgi:hypothetical protein